MWRVKFLKKQKVFTVFFYSLLPKATRGLLSKFVSFSESCKIKNEKP